MERETSNPRLPTAYTYFYNYHTNSTRDEFSYIYTIHEQEDKSNAIYNITSLFILHGDDTLKGAISFCPHNRRSIHLPRIDSSYYLRSVKNKPIHYK